MREKPIGGVVNSNRQMNKEAELGGWGGGAEGATCATGGAN